MVMVAPSMNRNITRNDI